MPDVLTPEQRKRNMKIIKAKEHQNRGDFAKNFMEQGIQV